MQANDEQPPSTCCRVTPSLGCMGEGCRYYEQQFRLSWWHTIPGLCMIIAAGIILYYVLREWV